MESIHNLFQAINTLVYLIYGQVFLFMGLAIAMQPRGRSRLELRRHLLLLAGFGLAHGTVELGYIVIPLERSYLPDNVISLMRFAQSSLQALSFYFLLQLGVRLMAARSPRWKLVDRVPGLVLAAWALWFGLSLSVGSSEETLVRSADILGRYTMALPGAFLIALGLLRQTQMIGQQGLAQFRTCLRDAAFAFFGYAVFGGLVVAEPLPTAHPGDLAALPGAFPLALLINAGRVEHELGIPVPIYRSLAGIAMAYFVVRALQVFEGETDQLIEAMEKERILSLERERIARELHDGIIQSIYAAGLVLEDAHYTMAEDLPVGQSKVEAAMMALDKVVGDIRAYIFDLHAPAEQDTLESSLAGLAAGLGQGPTRVGLQITGQPEGDVSAIQRFHLLQVAREALSNASRHADASQVTINLEYQPQGVRLLISDDGRGFDTAHSPPDDGHHQLGLSNIAERARQIAGTLRVDSAPGKGTRVDMEIPYSELRKKP
ncbi:MAG: sensor histidine kinase [Bacteroidetes bacterium]|nr:sensor histidine kinase [Bacteroidota bacterium]MCL5025026.1 sensor histidine kinase [Chloroflexota bacterium]